MSLVTVANARALINTSLSDANLQAVIDRVEAQVTGRIGEPWSDGSTPSSLAKTMRGEGMNLFMPTEIYSVTSIVEDTVTLTSDEYRVWGGGVIERLPMGSSWGDRVVVTYAPANDREKRSQVVIDLIRLVIERTAMASESVGGEYSYTAPDNWNREFNRAMRRLTFRSC